VNVTGATPTITNASLSQASVQVAGDSQFTLRLTITDDLGSTGSADVAIATPTAPVLTPPTSPSPGIPTKTGAGGGGAIDPALALALAMMCFVRRTRGSTLSLDKLPRATSLHR
jgi:MprA protease rhombosortase-interaction domain-containing protein